jgi:hypothetical protein
MVKEKTTLFEQLSVADDIPGGVSLETPEVC